MVKIMVLTLGSCKVGGFYYTSGWTENTFSGIWEEIEVRI